MKKVIRKRTVYEVSLEEFKTVDRTKYEPVELVFDDGTYYCDELFSVKYGKVRGSSYINGIVEWDKSKKQYVRMYHFSECPLGSGLTTSART